MKERCLKCYRISISNTRLFQFQLGIAELKEF